MKTYNLIVFYYLYLFILNYIHNNSYFNILLLVNKNLIIDCKQH